MQAPSAQDIAKLRESTGVGMMTAKKALVEAKGDFDQAVLILRKSGEKIAASKASRTMKEGAIGHYVHATGKVAALVVVTCETDFVVRSQPFQDLLHDLALHITAANPRYLRPEDVPADVLDQERQVYRGQLSGEKKPAALLETIIEGKLQKFYTEHCLLKQVYVKDDQLTIEQLIQHAIQKLGENIQVREFVRLAL